MNCPEKLTLPLHDVVLEKHESNSKDIAGPGLVLQKLESISMDVNVNQEARNLRAPIEFSQKDT